jgi:hypothetical protein
MESADKTEDFFEDIASQKRLEKTDEGSMRIETGQRSYHEPTWDQTAPKADFPIQSDVVPQQVNS